ncbi:MAG: SIMPL domain-containing protein [Oscillatoria sp. PMC 1051.18]|nr:SIMPL domain-containing protein [Oscillatoria sp. PMC 1050.18]MEC5029422.1 SIMPL domain-containing protein [Oscillatoria sp. PMC 1051.18]
MSGFSSKVKNRLTAATLALSVFGLAACQSSFASSPRSTLETIPRTLSVSGTGKVSIATTKTQVRLGVEVQGKTAQEVQAEVAQRSQAVVELLKSREVEKLETTGIQLNPRYDYSNGKQEIIGYTASNIVSFRIETAKAGNLMDEAVQAGASRIDGISFVADEETLEQARQQAIQEASAIAKKQAEAVLDSLNLQEKETIGIQVNGANTPPQPLNYKYAVPAAESLENAVTPVEGGEQQVEATVTLQIRY